MSIVGDGALSIAVAVAAGAFCQALTGMGFALLCSPLLVLVLGPHRGVPVVLVLSALLNLALLVRDYRAVWLRRLVPLLLPALLLTPLFAWGAHHAPSRPLAGATGCVAIVGVLVLAARVRLPWLRGRAGAIGLGALSALSNALAGTSGPPIAIYALNDDWPPRVIRPTFQLFFLALNLLALPFVGGGDPPLPAYAGLIAGLIAGAWAAPRLPERRARAAMMLVIGASGAVVLLRALLG